MLGVDFETLSREANVAPWGKESVMVFFYYEVVIFLSILWYSISYFQQRRIYDHDTGRKYRLP